MLDIYFLILNGLNIAYVSSIRDAWCHYWASWQKPSIFWVWMAFIWLSIVSHCMHIYHIICISSEKGRYTMCMLRVWLHKKEHVFFFPFWWQNHHKNMSWQEQAMVENSCRIYDACLSYAYSMFADPMSKENEQIIHWTSSEVDFPEREEIKSVRK